MKHFVREGVTQLLLLGCIDFLQFSFTKAIMSQFRSLVDRCSDCPVGSAWFKLQCKRTAAVRVLTKTLLCTLSALSPLTVLLNAYEINVKSPLGCALGTGTRHKL